MIQIDLVNLQVNRLACDVAFPGLVIPNTTDQLFTLFRRQRLKKSTLGHSETLRGYVTPRPDLQGVWSHSTALP